MPRIQSTATRTNSVQTDPKKSDNEKVKDWKRVAEFVVKRRYELRKTQRELYEEAGTGNQFWYNLENAKRFSYSMRNITGTERALGWPQGTIERILADKNYVPEVVEPDEPAQEELEEIKDQIAKLSEEVLELRFLVKQQAELVQPLAFLASQWRNGPGAPR